MYRFAVMNSSEPAFIDPTSVRNILPSGRSTGYLKLVLDGGHAVTVEGTTSGVYEILNQYRLHPVGPAAISSASEAREVDASKEREAHHAAQTDIVRESRLELSGAREEIRAAAEDLRDAMSALESEVPPSGE